MEKFTIINCTPHTVNVFDRGGNKVVDFPASGIIPRCSQVEEVLETLNGIIPRCSQVEEVLDTINGVEITRQTFGAVEGLPAMVPGTYLIVSRMVAEAADDRCDLLVPGPLVRGEDGQPRGCRGLSRI